MLHKSVDRAHTNARSSGNENLTIAWNWTAFCNTFIKKDTEEKREKTLVLATISSLKINLRDFFFILCFESFGFWASISSGACSLFFSFLLFTIIFYCHAISNVPVIFSHSIQPYTEISWGFFVRSALFWLIKLCLLRNEEERSAFFKNFRWVNRNNVKFVTHFGELKLQNYKRTDPIRTVCSSHIKISNRIAWALSKSNLWKSSSYDLLRAHCQQLLLCDTQWTHVEIGLRQDKTKQIVRVMYRAGCILCVTKYFHRKHFGPKYWGWQKNDRNWMQQCYEFSHCTASSVSHILNTLSRIYFDRNVSALYSIASAEFINETKIDNWKFPGNVCQQFLDLNCAIPTAFAFSQFKVGWVYEKIRFEQYHRFICWNLACCLRWFIETWIQIAAIKINW